MKLAPILLLSLVGCATAPRVPRSPERAARALAPAVAPTAARGADPRGLSVRLATDAKERSALHVEMALGTDLARTPLHFAPAHAVALRALEVHDARGPVGARLEGDALALARAADGPLVIRYEIAAPPAAEGPTPSADATTPVVEPTELRIGAEDALLLPTTTGRLALDVRLATGEAHGEGASSYGIGSELRADTTTGELAHAFFVAGDVGTARFSLAGDADEAAFVGYTAFDPRWVAAEVAGMRTAVDQALGVAPGASRTPLSLIIVSARRTGAPVVLARRTRGLLVSVDPGAAWTGEARLETTTHLAQRYVGGLVWLGDREDGRTGLLFGEGFARALARETLFDQGMLSSRESAGEVDALLAALALSPLERASLDELRTAEGVEPVRVLTARGALAATWLDGELRAGHGEVRSLAGLVRKILSGAAARGHDTISMDELVGEVRAATDDDRARTFSAILRGEQRAPLAPGALGRCYRPVAREVAAFELGLEVADLVVRSVIVGSRAEAAGVREGDRVVSLAYRDGVSTAPVEIVVDRGGSRRRMTFMPTGRKARATSFERVPGLDEDACRQGT
jgi:hypothetical protein